MTKYAKTNHTAQRVRHTELVVLALSSKPPVFFGPGRRKADLKKAILVVLLIVISSLKIPKLVTTQRSATKLCVHMRADIPHRSAVSYF